MSAFTADARVGTWLLNSEAPTPWLWLFVNLQELCSTPLRNPQVCPWFALSAYLMKT